MLRDCPCSTKTREVLGNPSPLPSRFPSTLEISLGLRPREISRVSGNLSGVGDGFPNTSLVLVEHGYNPRDLLPLRHLIRLMRRHDLAKKKTMIKTNTILNIKIRCFPHCIYAKRDLLLLGRGSSGWCQGQGKNEGEGQSQCRQTQLEPSGPQSSSFQSQVMVLHSTRSPLDRTTRNCQGLRIYSVHSVHQQQAIEDESIQPAPD